MPREEFAILLKKKWLVWLGLGAVFLFSLFLAGREFYRWYGINNEYKIVKNKTDSYEQESKKLQTEIDSLSKPEVLEKEARSRLNLKKEGESVLVVVGEDNFPEENFLKAEVGDTFNNPNSIWFNLKNWLKYFNIKK
ncbi:MAG: septum formation initiator family protein [bacterium]|nr:septum formation initiator family protein [bacterium]